MPRDLPVASQSNVGRHVLQLVQPDQGRGFSLNGEETAWPVFIGLLGPFRLLQAGHPVALRGNSKAAMLLGALALRNGRPVARETLLDLFWPESDAALAGEALRSLIRDLHKRVCTALGGNPLITHTAGYFRLNVDADISVDVACFDSLADTSLRETCTGNSAACVELCKHALDLYRGDLCLAMGEDEQMMVERERLRGRYFTLLTFLARYCYEHEDYTASLSYTQRVLMQDACREDAHRLAMCCYVRQGERSQALRQYHLCAHALRTLCDALPEPATMALLDQVRQSPNSI